MPAPRSEDLSQNLERALAFSATLRRDPRTAGEHNNSGVQAILALQNRRIAARRQLAPLTQAIAAPHEARARHGLKMLQTPHGPNRFVLGDAACPLAMRDELAQDAKLEPRRKVALQLLIKNKFSTPCAKALLRSDKNRSMDALLSDAASQALYFRAHKRLLQAPVQVELETGLLQLVTSIWESGIDPDLQLVDTLQDFRGTLLDQAMTLGDTEAVDVLLAQLWPIVRAGLIHFDTSVGANGEYDVGTPFIDPWIDVILCSPLRSTESNVMADMTHMLVAWTAKHMPALSDALRAHFVAQTLIKLASVKDLDLFRAALRAIQTHSDPGAINGARSVMQFCVLALWSEGIEALLDFGFNPNTRLNTAWMVVPDLLIGQSALGLAASQPNPNQFDAVNAIIELLLARGADPRLAASRPERRHGAVMTLTGLHFALESGNQAAAKRLLDAEISAPQTFAASDREVIGRLRKVLKACFYSRRGARVVPDKQALKVFTQAFMQASTDNFHLQNGTDPDPKKCFDTVGCLGVLAAEYVDAYAWATSERERQRLHKDDFVYLQEQAYKVAENWPTVGHIPPPSEFGPEQPLDALRATSFLEYASLAGGLNNLFVRFISIGDPEAAERLLVLHAKLPTRYRCMGAAFAMRKALRKDVMTARKAAYDRLVARIVDTMREPHGIRIMLELCCLLQRVDIFECVLEHAKRLELIWPTSVDAPLARNLLHLVVVFKSPFIETLLRHLSPAHVHRCAVQQDENGDTPLHLAARDKRSPHAALLAAIDQSDAYNIDNIAGRTPADEALLHANLPFFRHAAQYTTQAVASDVFGQAILNQPRTRRSSFIRSLDNLALLRAEHQDRLDGVFEYVMGRNDSHALRTLMDCFEPYIQSPAPNRATLLHMAAKLPSSFMIQALRKRLTAMNFARLTRCRDANNCYPEDYASSSRIHQFLRAWRSRPSDAAALDIESPTACMLSPLVDAVVQAGESRKQDAAIRNFVSKAEAFLAQSTTTSTDTDAVHQLAWQLLDTLASMAGPGCGVHFSAHRFDVSRNQLERRLMRLGSLGASRFGQRDALALLTLRQDALAQTQAAPCDASYVSQRSIVELHDRRLQGEGYVRSQTTGQAIAYEASPWVRFVLETTPQGMFIVSWYPIDDRT